MPINNDVYGVWKLLEWTDPFLGPTPQCYVVERAEIGTEQEIKSSPFVQGTALPLILNVSGATARIRITAPLLVTLGARATDRAMDTVSDGLRMWRDVLVGGGGAATAGLLLKSDYQTESGIVFEELGFSVDANQGCRYTINLLGDSNYLTEETVVPGGTGSGSGISLRDGTTVAGNGVYESAPVGGYLGPFKYFDSGGQRYIYPCRVATFYDVVGTFSYGGIPITGYLEKLNITYRFQTQGFNYVGQPTQRRILGMGGIEARVTGTMISGTRQPLGYQFGWQAMNDYNDIVAGTVVKTPYPQYGGTVKTSSIAFTAMLRDGTSGAAAIELVPGLTINQSLFQSSTQQVSSDLLRTEFNAFGWVTDPTPFS